MSRDRDLAQLFAAIVAAAGSAERAGEALRWGERRLVSCQRCGYLDSLHDLNKRGERTGREGCPGYLPPEVTP